MIARFRERVAGECPRRRRGLFAAAFLALFIVAPAVHGEEAETPAGERVRLIAAPQAAPGEPLLAGVEMRLAPGWHTYWRKTGDSGLAPRFDWSASANVASVDLRWPAPRRFDEPGDATFGYENEVVWPVLVRAADPAKPVTLRLTMSYGVCRDICVPGEAHLTLGKATAEDGETIRRFLARVPTAPRGAETVSARAGNKSLIVTLKGVEGETPDVIPDLIIEGPRGLWFGKPEPARKAEAISYTVPVEIEDGATLKGAEVTLTFSSEATAIEASRKVE